MKVFQIQKFSLSFCLTIAIAGLCTNISTAANPDKVVALIALDTEPHIKVGKAIKKGGKVIENTLDNNCTGKITRTALNVNRSRGVNPRDLLTKIKEMKTDENSILFLFVCSHGTYSNNEHYLFAYHEGDTLTGLKRADVIAALKKKNTTPFFFFPMPVAMKPK